MDAKYKDFREDFGHCLISYMDWLDAFKEGDCFCITFDAIRAEGGIIDPSLITIKAINTTQLTAESFLDSALFITKAGQIIRGSGRHGAIASTLVKGLPEEVITGILPIFINEDHWKIARLRIKPLLAWTTAQDVLAFKIQQLLVLPFLVLAKAAVCQTTEHKKKQFKIILETCTAIYRDYKGLILPELHAKIENYATKPEIRTIDSIPNNSVFLMHLYVGSNEGDIEIDHIRKILPYVIEEELRRYSFKLDMDLHEFYKILLDVDNAKYITPYLENISKEFEASIKASSLGKAEKIKEILKEQNKHVEKEESKIVPKEEVKDALVTSRTFEIDTNYLSDFAAKQVERYQTLLIKEDWNPSQLNNLLPLFDQTPYLKLDDFGVNTPAKKVVFVSQTCIQKVNADRREACKQGNVIDILNEAACCEEIKKIYRNTVELERNNGRTKIITQISKSSSSGDSYIFATTKDIYEAAGVLHGVLRGSSQFKYLHLALRSPNCPLVTEKCKMLVSGNFQGIKLLMDNIVNPKDLSNGFVTWKASKKNCYQIFKANATNAELKDWIDAFPHLAEYIKYHHGLLQE